MYKSILKSIILHLEIYIDIDLYTYIDLYRSIYIHTLFWSYLVFNASEPASKSLKRDNFIFWLYLNI